MPPSHSISIYTMQKLCQLPKRGHTFPATQGAGKKCADLRLFIASVSIHFILKRTIDFIMKHNGYSGKNSAEWRSHLSILDNQNPPVGFNLLWIPKVLSIDIIILQETPAAFQP